MSTRSRIAAFIVALVAMVGIAAAPATAAPAPDYNVDDCSQGQLCLFDTKLVWPGYHRYVINDRPSGTCFDLPVDWDNRANRINNLTTHSVTFYTGNSCNGALLPYPILPQTKANFNCCDNGDEANSVLFQGGSGCSSLAPCFNLVAGNTHNRVSAQAATGYSRCEWGEVCLFTGVDGGGTIYPHAALSGTCLNMVGGANNSADSFINKRPQSDPDAAHHVQFYDGANCTGTLLAIGAFGNNDGPFPSGTKANFAKYNPRGGGEINFRNRVTSIFWNTG